MKIEKDRALPIIRAALKEDIGKGDITTSAVIDKFSSSKASIITKEDCVVCGMDIAEWTMAQVDYSVRFKPNCNDGDPVGAGKELAFLEGHVDAILRAERTILNFLSFLSGISTKTRQLVDKAKPYGVAVMDTRKTLPLLRYLEKHAVCVGGGRNHRMGLYDQVLIKDNHIKWAGEQGKDVNLRSLVEKIRKKSLKNTVVEIEVETIEEFSDALAGKPDIIMLDNMSSRDVMACVDIRRLSKAKPLLEVSGGITLDTIEEYAKTKVDMISIGSITSSVADIDMSLELI
ncbi:MAG: carboxylating nicotinate-nucleotide diphosphorylase [Candidatus Omnitrophota bacterium]|jgi:nicotinate-nucleotide pyrophosphorylase (carboxylating)